MTPMNPHMLRGAVLAAALLAGPALAQTASGQVGTPPAAAVPGATMPGANSAPRGSVTSVGAGVQPRDVPGMGGPGGMASPGAITEGVRPNTVAGTGGAGGRSAAPPTLSLNTGADPATLTVPDVIPTGGVGRPGGPLVGNSSIISGTLR
jgi:hypothetical protein